MKCFLPFHDYIFVKPPLLAKFTKVLFLEKDCDGVAISYTVK